MPIQQDDPFDGVHSTGARSSDPNPADYVRFALGAAARRKGAVALASSVCFGLVIAFYFLQPPLFRAETRILAQRQQALPSIIRSNVAEDQPTRAASEIIKRRDNLLELVRLSGLLDAPPKPERFGWLNRTAPWLSGPGSPDADPVEGLIRVLDKRLKVEAGDFTIRIELDWPDPQQAYRIVDGALQNFLEARHVQEVTTLDEAIAILRGRAVVVRGELDRAIDEARRAVASGTTRPPRAYSPTAATSSRQGGAEDLVQLRSMIQAKERAIADVESFRRRRLTELQAQYESRRAALAEGHPEMVSLRLDMATLSGDSPQIVALRAEERALREEYQSRLARQPAPIAEAVAPGEATSSLAAPRSVEAAIEQNERVREARSRYQEIMDSVNRAQLDLDTTRSAFKHRYKIIWPVQVPKKPVSPNPFLIFGIGGFAALFVALLFAAALDWNSGRILERWQIEQGLNLPVLGQFPRDT